MGKVLLLSSGGKAVGLLALGKSGQLCIRRAVPVYIHGAVGWWMQVTRLLLSTCDADGGRENIGRHTYSVVLKFLCAKAHQ